MALKIKNLRLSPYSQKDNIKVIFGDELHLSFEIPHVDGESYLCALDNERILYPINRPVCAYTSVFTRDGDDVDFTLKLTTSKLRDYVSSIKKPMPVWLQIVREVNGKYETVLLDDILAIPSVIDGSMTVYEGDSFKELLDAKMNIPEAEGTDGQVLTLDADGHYSWQDLPIQEQVQSDWDESDSESPAFIKNKPESTVVNDGKITVNQGGIEKGTFTVNQAGDTVIDLNDGAQSDWDESDSSDVSYIRNKPTLFSGDYNDLTNKPNLATVATSGSYNDLTNKPIITQPVNADWDESDSENLAYIFNKPTIPAAQVQADYAQTDTTAVDFIKNKPDTNDYLCFTALANNSTVGLNKYGSVDTINLEYSLDKINWTAYAWSGNTGTTVTLTNVGDKVYFRGDNDHFSKSDSSQYYFVISAGQVAASGNIMSLLDKTCQSTEIPTAWCFTYLFYNCANLVSVSKGLLPATKLTSHCYDHMFHNAGIVNAPELPCEDFGNATHVYNFIFNRCSSLVTPPSVLPALTVGSNCYANMFYECSSLATAPVIRATTAGDKGLYAMFWLCTSLTEAPEISLTTTGTQTCEYLCASCSNLKHVKVGFTAFPQTNDWLDDVSATGIFECPSALTVSTRGGNTVPAGWTIVRTDAPQSDWNQTDTTEASYIKNKPDLSTKLDAPTTAGTVGQVLTKTADGQEWADDEDEDTLDALDDTITMLTSIVGELSDKNYFHVTALQSSSVTFRGCDYSRGNSFEYSYDRREWFKADLPLTVSLATGEILWLRNAEEPNGWDIVNYPILSGVGGVTVGGELLSLASKSVDRTKVFSDGGRRLHTLFRNWTALKGIESSLNLNINGFQGNFYEAFRNTGLTDIPDNLAFPEGVTTVERLFYECSSLTNVGAGFVIPNTVTNISGMFYNCSALVSIEDDFTIPSGVTSMDSSTFNGLNNLTTIGNNVSINPATNSDGGLNRNTITSIGTGFDYMSSYTTSSSSGQAVFPNAAIGSGWKIYQYSDL